MSWNSPAPLESSWWKDALEDKAPRELFAFLREIYNRHNTFGTFVWDGPNVPASSTVDTTLTSATLPQLAALRTGQPISVSPPPSIGAGLSVGGAWVPADGQLTIRLSNGTGGAIDPASGTWSFQGVVA